MGNNIDLGRRFFTNTYITGSGRQNYLRIDELEDPLFTSFTLDIDYVSSPLFYTINNDFYGYPNVEGMGDRIESALKYMYEYDMNVDQGYDILPALSASILDGNKLGFGLQQNVYMDLPLYGATEYIYMVDKRNGAASQNDARFDNNRFVEQGGNPNTQNSYKLGDSVKEIINDSDRKWAENQQQQLETTIKESSKIVGGGNEGDSDYFGDDSDFNKEYEKNKSVRTEHKKNEDEYNTSKSDFENYKVYVDGYPNNKEGVEGDQGYNESELLVKIEEYKKSLESFDSLKKEIVDAVNKELIGYQTNGTNIYNSSKCVKKIEAWDDINIGDNKDKYTELLEKSYKDYKTLLFTGDKSFCAEFIKLFNELKTYSGNDGYKGSIKDDGKSFILNGDNKDIVRQSFIIDKFNFKDKLNKLELCDKDGNLKGNIIVEKLNTPPDWATIFDTHIVHFADDSGDYKDVGKMIDEIMRFNCDIELGFDKNFTSDKIKKDEDTLTKFELALVEIRTKLYGYKDGEVCDNNNATPDSLYGQYMAAKEKLENDDYTQAEKMKAAAQSGLKETNNMIKTDDTNQNLIDNQYNESIRRGVQPEVVNRKQSIVSLQTVLDMLGFISGMKKMTIQYPYIIQGVTGLDTAYNKHYGIKDPYLGSGEDKITLTCLESLDLRVSSMFNRYFNAVYDRQYRRERVPVNLRRFNCSIYVHDVRNFVAKSRLNTRGEYKTTYNRLLELTDMYYSVIEFRFFDCEIVPEETGNIFNDISNEAPSEMKKTNFTFTYGNCVVNFVPPSEVAEHNNNMLN